MSTFGALLHIYESPQTEYNIFVEPTNNQERLQRLRRHTEIGLVLAIFFPVLLEALYKLESLDADIGRHILTWSVGVPFIILFYILIEINGKNLHRFVLSAVDYLAFAHLAAFGITIFAMSSSAVRPVVFSFDWSLSNVNIFTQTVLIGPHGRVQFDC